MLATGRMNYKCKCKAHRQLITDEQGRINKKKCSNYQLPYVSKHALVIYLLLSKAEVAGRSSIRKLTNNLRLICHIISCVLCKICLSEQTHKICNYHTTYSYYIIKQLIHIIFSCIGISW